MNISEISIRRPVLATVMTVIILLFGLIGYNYLGVREYPSVDNPIISVSCSYPGANADVIENQITEPLEQNINGIPGIRSLSSVSSQDRVASRSNSNCRSTSKTAANDVRDKVSRAHNATCPRLRSADRIESRCGRFADPDGRHPQRQTLAAGTERNRRPDGQRTTSNDQRRQQRFDLG